MKEPDLAAMPWKEVRDLVEIIVAEGQVSKMQTTPDPSPAMIRAMKGSMTNSLPPSATPDGPAPPRPPGSGLIPIGSDMSQ